MHYCSLRTLFPNQNIKYFYSLEGCVLSTVAIDSCDASKYSPFHCMEQQDIVLWDEIIGKILVSTFTPFDPTSR